MTELEERALQYLDRQEQIQHRTGDVPLGYYPVDEHFPRYRMQLHWHREAEMIWIRRGRLRMVIDGDEIDADAGDLVCIASGSIHGAEPENSLYQCIVFDAEALLPQAPACRAPALRMTRQNLHIKNRMIRDNPPLGESIERLFGICENGMIGYEADLAGAMMLALSALRRAVPEDHAAPQSDQNWRRSEQIKPALEYIEQNFREHISLDTLAALSGFSPKYFCRYFRAIVHRSPIDYLNYYRVECAAQYLRRADMNVAEVAALCGYADSSAFIKQFRKYKGTTPKQYKLHQVDSEANQMQ